MKPRHCSTPPQKRCPEAHSGRWAIALGTSPTAAGCRPSDVLLPPVQGKVGLGPWHIPAAGGADRGQGRSSTQERRETAAPAPERARPARLTEQPLPFSAPLHPGPVGMTWFAQVREGLGKTDVTGAPSPTGSACL